MAGWSQNSEGERINSRPENLKFLRGSSAAMPHPVEDIAESSAMMVINPAVLSEDRIKFFLNNPYYKDWPAVQVYQESHSVNQ